ncbi:LOW QUALITY PROTEIN: TATE DNA transposons [Leishmania braziliensis MHOM/BR/75/M2904]|uniref:TATE DNA transposons n=1 Tax=Leishmania braziliensis TaxID=5660 RepID=A4H6R2_LEIBR|nr:LOW QUALITY PROTEIN: TATE DNA transposons [Leishmania braziliensis MHOM/BR/75/M2904]CAM42016.1 TATE DNA transposons [Leishmania braziliensis MHOM/BR/75/M2904]
MWGGDMREGKTSNIELDVIYKAYLPKKWIVPSDTMVHLDWKRAQQLKAKVHRHGVVYFPIFIMKHWIAGLLEKGTRDSAEIQLSILDSAPSPIVEEKLRKHFKMVWPALRLVNEFSPRQERYSDDCGLYMSAVFFGVHLDIQIDHSHDMAKCMRRLLYAASKHHPPREYFLEKMRKILTNHPVSRKDFFYNEIEHKPWLKKTTVVREDTFHLGGGERRATKSTNPKRDSRRANQPKARSPKPPPRQKKKEETVRTKMDRAERPKRTPQTPVPASKAPSRKRPERSAMDAPLPRRKAARKSDRRTPASSSGRSATGRNGNKTRSLNSSEFPSDDEDLPVIDLPWRKKNSVTRTPEHAPNDATVSSEGIIPTNVSPHVQHGKCISEWTEITLAEANKHARKVYEAVLDHLWAATALARVGDGVAHGLTDTAVGQQRVRHKLTPLQPYSVQEMLKLLRKKIHMVDASPTDPNGVILREENRSEEVTLNPAIDELYLVRGPSLPTLYDVIKGYRFLLGACLREAPADVNGVRYPSHYVLTKDASEATVGVYVPATWTHYQSSKRQRAPRHASRYIPLPRSAASEAHQDPSDGQRPRLVKRKRWPGDGAGRDPLQEDEEDGATYRTPGNQKGDGYADVDANISAEAMRALESLRSNPLNMQGRPLSKNEGRGLPEKLVPLRRETATHLTARMESCAARHPRTPLAMVNANQVDELGTDAHALSGGMHRLDSVDRKGPEMEVGNNREGLCRGGGCAARPAALLDAGAGYSPPGRSRVAKRFWHGAALHEGVGAGCASLCFATPSRSDHRKTPTRSPSCRAVPRHDVGIRSASVRHFHAPSKGRDAVPGSIDGYIREGHADDPQGKGCQNTWPIPDPIDANEGPRSDAAGDAGREKTIRGAFLTTRGGAAGTDRPGGAKRDARCTAALDPERRAPLHGGSGCPAEGPDDDLRAREAGHAAALSWVWPAAYGGGRDRKGQRRKSAIPDPLEAAASVFRFRSQESSCANLGIAPQEVSAMVDQMSGFIQVLTERPALVKQWPLHLKRNTPLDMDTVLAMPTKRASTKRFLQRIQCFLDPSFYDGLRTSRTIKKCALTAAEIQQAIEMGKFEPCPISDIGAQVQLPEGMHGVNVFTVPELKGRRRLITEPLLNRVIPKHHVPRVHYDTRLGRRQRLRYARYMLQIDFEAYYDAIPIAATLRNKFVFRARHDGRYYRLRTLPTGARWSVAVGQAVTWTIVDIDTPVTITTLIDNILVAAREGQEREFVLAVRTVVARIKAANLMTSPNRDELEAMSDEEILQLASANTVFLGEDTHGMAVSV